MEPVWFVLSQLAFILFGAPAAFHPSIRSMGFPARIAACFGLGAIVLTAEAILFSMFGMRWGNRTMAIPLIVVAGYLSWRMSRRPAPPRFLFRPNLPMALLGAALIAAALVVFVHATVIGAATSPDLVLFEGTKAVRFAVAKGFDANFLRSPFSAHTHPNAPPLFPVTLSWYALGREEPMWTWAPLTAAIWLVAGIPLVLELLRQRLDDTLALCATAFWTVAMSIALVHAHSAGTSDAPWLFYGTMAFAAMLTMHRSEPRLAVSAAALAGLTLTRSAGLLTSVLLVTLFTVSTLADEKGSADDGRTFTLRRMAFILAAPVLSFALWNLFLFANRLPVADPAQRSFALWSMRWWEAITATEISSLHLGTWGLSTLLPCAMILLSVHRWNSAMRNGLIFAATAAVVVSIGYMREWTNPTDLVAATFPRYWELAASVIVVSAAIIWRRPQPSLDQIDEHTAR